MYVKSLMYLEAKLYSELRNCQPTPSVCTLSNSCAQVLPTLTGLRVLVSGPVLLKLHPSTVLVYLSEDSEMCAFSLSQDRGSIRGLSPSGPAELSEGDPRSPRQASQPLRSSRPAAARGSREKEFWR